VLQENVNVLMTSELAVIVGVWKLLLRLLVMMMLLVEYYSRA
jgi:hypothetical protein